MKVTITDADGVIFAVHYFSRHYAENVVKELPRFEARTQFINNEPFFSLVNDICIAFQEQAKVDRWSL